MSRDLTLLLTEIERSGAHPHVRLRDLARRLSLSERWVRELLKRHTGVSFSTYRRRTRIDLVLKLLDGPESIKHIASVAGYDSTSSLDREFKRVFGVAPAQYRRMIKA
jgi:AraC-like DNA-binding protein